MTELVERATAARDVVLKLAVSTGVVGVALVIYAAYGDPHTKANQTAAVPFLSVVVVVVTALVFGLLVPRGLARIRSSSSSASRWALVPGIASVVLLIGFWSGVPLVIGSAAAFLGSRPGRDGALRTSTAAVWLGGIAVLVSLVMTILGNTVLSN